MVAKARTARFLLPPPGDESVGQLIATIDAYEAAIAKLRGRIEMYRGNYKAHGHDIALARLETAEVILADFTDGVP